MTSDHPRWLRLYALMLRAYPSAFRAEHADEMRAVFAERLGAAAGRRARWAVMLHELRDWPGAVLRQHRRSWALKEVRMPAAIDFSVLQGPDLDRPGSEREAGLAAFPHAWLALWFAWMASGLTDDDLSLAMMPGVLGVLLIPALVIAWRGGWPRWSLSWGAAWLLGALALATQVITVWWPAMLLSQRLAEGVFWTLIGLALPATLLGLAQRDRVRALLLAIPFGQLLWIPVLEFVSNHLRNPLQALSWALAAAVAFCLVRGGSVRLGVAGTLALTTATGVAYAVARTYFNTYPSGGIWVRPGYWLLPELLYNLVPNWVALAALLIGPILAGALWRLGRAGGAFGRAGVWLTMTGLTLAVLGNVAGIALYLWSGPVAIGRPVPAVTPAIQVAAYGGMAALLIGLALTVEGAQRAGRLHGRWLPAALIGAPLALPLAVMLPLWMGFRSLPPSVPFGFLPVSDFELPTHALALAWLSVASALTLYLSRPNPTSVGKLQA